MTGTIFLSLLTLSHMLIWILASRFTLTILFRTPACKDLCHTRLLCSELYSELVLISHSPTFLEMVDVVIFNHNLEFLLVLLSDFDSSASLFVSSSFRNIRKHRTSACDIILCLFTLRRIVIIFVSILALAICSTLVQIMPPSATC